MIDDGVRNEAGGRTRESVLDGAAEPFRYHFQKRNRFNSPTRLDECN